MPAGCDSVIPQEHVASIGESDITIDAGAIRTGDNRRFAGEDLMAGSAALKQGQDHPPGRPWPAGLARHRRSAGAAAPARRLLLDRRRTALDRRTARRRLRLRQQPLHAVRHADPPRLRHRRHGHRQGRPAGAGRRAAQRLRKRRRHRHLRRRIGRRRRLHARDHGQAGRRHVLEDRHASGPPARLRQDQLERPQRLPVWPARQSGRGDGVVLLLRPRPRCCT